MIYIDFPVAARRGATARSHLLPDPLTMDLEELHTFAKKIGLQREWFHNQNPARFPHYVIKGRRMWTLAAKHGATKIHTNDWTQQRRA